MKRVWGVIALLTVLQMAFVNCGRVGFEASKGTLAGLNLGSSDCDGILLDAYSKTYFPLLSVSCNACHSDAHGSTDLNMSYQGFKTKTVTVIDSRATNPHGGNAVNLTNEIAAIKPEWDASQDEYLACVAKAAAETPIPGPPAPSPGALESTFSSIQSQILQPKCVSCHSTNTASKGISFSTYIETLSAVVPQNASMSSLYISVSTNTMPMGGPALSAEEISAIQIWIQNGAMND